ncbi:MAG: tryptophan synthase subunit alpha, partial [Chloroflexota bacterium]
VTGARDSLPEDLERSVARVKSVTSLPLCVGFGISTAAQAAQVARIADGVIVGSRIVQLMEAGGDLASLRTFIRELRAAIDKEESP